MNRKILDGILVLDGHSYANDALQAICAKLTQYDNHKFMKLLDSKPTTEEEKEEAQKQSHRQRIAIGLFNSVVEQGKDFAVAFILKNDYLFK